LDPDALPAPDRSKIDFSSDRKRAWKDIWGSGQGIGVVREIEPAAALISRLRDEYRQAVEGMGMARALIRPE
jgi:nitronate monooxygenase